MKRKARGGDCTKDFTQKRYGQWAGNPAGQEYRVGYCAKEILDRSTWHLFKQGTRKVKEGEVDCGTHKKTSCSGSQA